MTLLLDANVLIALVNESHVHHERSQVWFAETKPSFATCPITEGALVRHYFRETELPSAQEAKDIIREIHQVPGHHFWSDTLSYSDIDYRGVIGHRQITDAYLVFLARMNDGRLATMDKGLSELHPETSTWVPSLV